MDFRRLNELTETQTFPMPDLEEEISKMNGSKIFSTLDLHSAFHQIELAEEDRELTSFQPTTRKLQFKRMPFGLKGSPITWQRVINLILGELLHENNMAYMDDIISYNKTIEEHIQNLRRILQRLREYNLKLKVEKTKFVCKEVKYLGHIISPEGISTDPDKVACMSKFVAPKNIIEVQRFLGVTYYYRKFIKYYSTIANPLFNLSRKNVPFIWDEACNEAFETLRRAAMTTPILAFPKQNEIYYVTTDASKFAAAAVLSQGTPPFDRPIQYFSKTFKAEQLNYAAVHKELLAIVMSIEHFKYYPFGRQFIVRTDSRPLTSIFRQTKLNSRFLRYKLFFIRV